MQDPRRNTRAQKRIQAANHALVNGSGKLAYFEQRNIERETVRRAYVGYEAEVFFPDRNGRGYTCPAFTYPCIAKGGELLGIHLKSEARNSHGKRWQRWDAYANGLPPKGHGKNPNKPAKVIPFGMETLRDLEVGSLAVLCCGEEDALILRQVGHTALSQPGAGLLEPVYAKELVGFDVVVFYDAGEEHAARKDALKLEQGGARSVRVVEWPPEDSSGTDINEKLINSPQGFASWAEEMITKAVPPTALDISVSRSGESDAYGTVAFEPTQRPWPTLAEDALYGLPGDIVREIEPHTEADTVAVLANLLAAFGNAVGRGPLKRINADRHHLKINAVLVGDTAKGRKGTSWGPVRELMCAADPEWGEQRVANGLSSGEGLINAVRDADWVSNEDEESSPNDGVEDKRLFVLESELAGVLKVMKREGNTLSPVIRQAWDDGRLQTLTKKDPMKATDTHVSIVGHITKSEVLKHLTETEAANGFANRFLWLAVGRSKELPFGGEWHKIDKAPLIRRLRSALEFGKDQVEVEWGESAKDDWREVYGALSEGKHGLFGSIVSRAEAQVIRLAAIYAVMSESNWIERDHLKAALALWSYAEESARYIFGDATGDAVADRIMEALRASGTEGMSRTDMRDLFKRNAKAERIDMALALLSRMGWIYKASELTAGRPAVRWFLK